jgi:hypothetical protein
VHFAPHGLAEAERVFPDTLPLVRRFSCWCTAPSGFFGLPPLRDGEGPPDQISPRAIGLRPSCS